MAKATFPKVLYVRRDVDGDETYYIADTERECVIDGDGPTTIAVYNLTDQTQTYRKVAKADD